MPTTDCSSPTTTRAVNEKRRPPLTTLATRLISITRSWRSRPCGLTVSMSRFIRSSDHRSDLETQPALAGALGERLDPAVVPVSAPVEQAALHPRLLGAAGEHLARALGLLERRQLAPLGLGPRDGRDGPRRVVVDELGEHPAVGAKHRQARTLRRAADLRAHPAATAHAALWLGLDGHGYARFPTLRLPCSPAYLTPLPL